VEPELSDELYLLFRDLLRKRSGMFYPEHKRTDLVHGLGQAMHTTQQQTFATLYEAALAGGEVWEAILVNLTIGETSFLRNKPQFDALRGHVFPELFERQKAYRTLRIWSAGCATGEEPYSLAMLLVDLLPKIETWNISILATDLNPLFLGRAREAVYGNWSFREVPDEIRDRFFLKEQHRWRLKPEICRMVNFMRLNLVEQTYPSLVNGTCNLDMLVCRNVTIYFDEETTRKIVERFYAALAPGGWLIVGHAEPQVGIYRQFEVHNLPNTVLYRKALDSPLFIFDLGRNSFNPPPPPPSLPAAPKAQTKPLGPLPPKSKSSLWQAQAAPSANPGNANLFPPLGPKSPTDYLNPPLTPKIDPWLLIRERLAQGDKMGAEALLRSLIREEPGQIEALTLLGRLCADRGEWFSAQSYCEQALERDPLYIEAHYVLAQLYEHQGRLDEALAAYRRTIYLNRNFVPGTLGMANVWRSLGRVAEAQRGYRNVLKQLTIFAPTAGVPGLEGATAAELITFVTKQLQALELES